MEAPATFLLLGLLMSWSVPFQQQRVHWKFQPLGVLIAHGQSTAPTRLLDGQVSVVLGSIPGN